MGIIGIASSGMGAAMARLGAAAQNIAAAGAVDDASAGRVEAVASAVAGGGVRASIVRAHPGVPDPADALVSTMTASLAYRANASVIHAADALIGTLIDMAG
jgi:flagellar basal body rod protein FlgC